MTEHAFSLLPFPDANLPAINIRGIAARQNNTLTIHYSLVGEIQNIFLPSLSPAPGRKDDLWKATCFEFFLAVPHQPPYWEFNLSASGDWNAYYMEAFRRIGFREETLITRLPFSVRKEADCIAVDASLDLSPICSGGTPIQMGITSVISAQDGHGSYWALAHPNPHPDFHLRESFTLVLAE